MKCAMAACLAESRGKSKYCTPHAKEARSRWIAMIAAKADEREHRVAEYAALYERAHKAGMAAGEVAAPRTMIVTEHENPLDDNSPVKTQYRVPEGICGFAWVVVGGNTSFGRWLTKQGLGKKHYPSGICVWVSAFDQSYKRKSAYASAFADVLRAAGITAYAGGRLD